MTCEMEFNQRGLQIPNELLAALALSDITLEAHMCRHLIMLMPQAMTVVELIDVLEGMQEAFDQLLNGLIEAMGTKYGVVMTQLQGRGWTHWLEIPYINYD